MTPKEYLQRNKQAAGCKEINSYVLQTVKHVHSSLSLYVKLLQRCMLLLWPKVKLFCVRIGGQSSTSTGMIYATGHWTSELAQWDLTAQYSPGFIAVWLHRFPQGVKLHFGPALTSESSSVVTWNATDWPFSLFHVSSSLEKVLAAEQVQITLILSATAYYTVY